ncbi:POTRA domain-containing protein, partial [Chromobacterium haemolyticum]
MTAQAAEVPGMSGSMHQQMENDSRRLLQDNSRRFDAIIQQHRLRQMQPDSNMMRRPQAADMSELDCLRVKGVRLAGIKLLSRKEVASLGELASDCLNNEELNRYSRALTQLYLKKGYIAARVAAEGPDEQGVLTLRVHEGRVEKIVSDDSRSNPATLFPGVVGRPLNIHDADQGLDQANRLPSSKATLD